jgi:hypothetical protein
VLSIRASSLKPTGVLLCCSTNTAGKLNLQCCSPTPCNPVECTCKNRSGGNIKTVKPFSKLYLKNNVPYKRSLQLAMGWAIRNSYPGEQRDFLIQTRINLSWGPPSLLCNGYWCSFPLRKDLSVALNTQSHLTSKLRMCGNIPPFPHLCLHWLTTR